MSKIVVLSEINCIKYLRMHGFHPSEFYMDLDDFKERSSYFNDVIVVMILSNSCTFSQKRVNQMRKTLQDRAESKSDGGIVDFILVSDSIQPSCEDYFLYVDNPLSCIRYSKTKPVSNEFDLRSLAYDPSEETYLYLTDKDYGYDKEALERVRTVHDEEKQLISLLKVPTFGA